MAVTFNETSGIFEDDKGAMYLISTEGYRKYKVAKFLDGDVAPSETYTVINDGKWKCSCPGFHRRVTTKHIDIVKEWLKREKPLPTVFCDIGFMVGVA